MEKILLALLLLLGSFALAAEKIYYEDDVDVKEAYKMQKEGAILIDVRTAGEYIYAGHPLKAISIPIFSYHYQPKDITLRINFAKKEQEKALDAHKIYNITPVENREFVESVRKVRKTLGNKAILVICRSGTRSKYAANLLAKNGFSEIYNVEGGFLEWKKAKLPFGGE